MNMKLVAGLVLLFLTLSLGSCGGVEIQIYEHAPSERFHRSWDFDAEELFPFKANDILLALNVDHMHTNVHSGWLSVYARSSGKSVFIHEVEILGVNQQTKKVLDTELVLSAKVERANPVKDSINLFVSYLEFEIESDSLKRAVDDDGNLILKVYYSVDGLAGVMSFKLSHRVEEWWPVSPT